MRCAGSTLAVTVDMNGALGSRKWTCSIAGRSRSAALATSGLWNAPETLQLDGAARAVALGLARSTPRPPSSSPETTIWPGQL